MSTKIFLNLPVKDLQKSMAFFKALGGTFNKQFTDETAASLVISEDIYAMLLTHARFSQFTDKKIADTSKTAQVLIALSQDSKEAVHKLVDAAVKAGAKEPRPMQDYGFMINRTFEDLDGHIWEVLYMDPTFEQPTN
jgi:predicted lactoylglutathione lyase